MDYFLIHGDQKDTYLTIGTDNGFGVFWADQGLRALMNIVDKEPEKLTKVQIKNEQNHTMTISEFLEKIDKLKVRIK
jgi:hypothetical protein